MHHRVGTEYLGTSYLYSANYIWKQNWKLNLSVFYTEFNEKQRVVDK